MKNKILVLAFLISVGAFLRVINLGWDQGHFLHPDERLYVNASILTWPNSIASFFSPTSPLNPHMFYYGSFPLYLYRFIDHLFFGGGNILLTSRFISSIFSIATAIIIYRIGKSYFNEKVGLLSVFVYVFLPGSIQHAHFNTTESMLIFFISVIILYSNYFMKNHKYRYLLCLSIVCGLSYGSKVTGLTFLLFPLISLIPLLIKRQWLRFLNYGLFFSLIFLPVAFLAAPYQIIDWSQFYKEQSFMQGVILGKSKPPFTIIYEGTLPYFYPMLQVAPFIFGFLTFPFSLFGIYKLIRLYFSKTKQISLLLLILFPVIYFLWTGSWFAKYTRYYVIISPFIAIWTGVALGKINKKILIVVLVIIAINGLLMLRLYTKTNTRLQASYWINENITSGKIIAGEHWDDNLPLPLPRYTNTHIIKQLNVYEPDTATKIATMASTLATSDYFTISSRRVYQSILNNEKLYPYTSRFYKLLFTEKLGYKLIHEFTSYPFYFSDDFADESFQSYDHPPVKIYKNLKHLSAEELNRKILHGK